jgi:hypothetical protein
MSKFDFGGKKMEKGKNPNYTFRLASPKYLDYIDFLAKAEKTTHGKALNILIHKTVYEIIDAQASEKAHKKLAMEYAGEIDINTVSWILGSRTNHWQRLSNTIGMEKALEYQKKFSRLWEKYGDEINETVGLDYFDAERRAELASFED